MAGSPQALPLDDRRLLGAWAADCAEGVLGIYEDLVPRDGRLREAIVEARAFAGGDLGAGDAIRRRGGDAGGAARAAPTPAARAAAHAAEQAAAVAHMGAHALGAAGYAATAAALASDEDTEQAVRAEARRLAATTSDAVARALSALPTLGEDRSGPLGPGRLSGGLVGVAIREIQTELRDR